MYKNIFRFFFSLNLFGNKPSEMSLFYVIQLFLLYKRHTFAGQNENKMEEKEKHFSFREWLSSV